MVVSILFSLFTASWMDFFLIVWRRFWNQVVTDRASLEKSATHGVSTESTEPTEPTNDGATPPATSGRPEELASEECGNTHIPILSPKVSRSWTDGWQFLANVVSRAASCASVIFIRVLRRF